MPASSRRLLACWVSASMAACGAPADNNDTLASRPGAPSASEPVPTSDRRPRPLEQPAPPAYVAPAPNMREVEFSDAQVREALGPPADAPRDPELDALLGERGPREVRYRAAIAHRWKAEPAIRAIALELWDTRRVMIGTEPAHVMDGGFRGRLHLVPEPPTGPHAKHLGWLRDAHVHFDEVFTAVRARAPGIDARRFATGGIVYGFFRSVGRTTPSAYASSWHIAYNVSGSLHASGLAVEDTLFHEIFHVNDESDKWSGGNLRAIHTAILERCKDQLAAACLAPYAPTTTMVRGGTYYAFQPDNGDAVDEYGAEIATRWYQEHRALVKGTPPPQGSPWKCRTPENARAWELVAGAFFAGVDLVPACT